MEFRFNFLKIKWHHYCLLVCRIRSMNHCTDSELLITAQAGSQNMARTAAQHCLLLWPAKKRISNHSLWNLQIILQVFRSNLWGGRRGVLENVKSGIFWLRFYMNTNILNDIPSISPESTCVTATVPHCPGHPATSPPPPKYYWSSKQLRAQRKTWLCRWPLQRWAVKEPETCSTFLNGKPPPNKQTKKEYLHCDLLLILKIFSIINYSIKLLEMPLYTKYMLHDRLPRRITDKREARFCLLTLSKSSQYETVCCSCHKTRWNAQCDEEWFSPVQVIPNTKRYFGLRVLLYPCVALKQTHTHTQM